MNEIKEQTKCPYCPIIVVVPSNFNIFHNVFALVALLELCHWFTATDHADFAFRIFWCSKDTPLIYWWLYQSFCFCCLPTRSHSWTACKSKPRLLFQILFINFLLSFTTFFFSYFYPFYRSNLSFYFFPEV